jgi:SAM-dependent methyltransferase
MTSPFDGCASRYESEVQSSIDFSGLRHDFFLAAKADILARTWSDHFGARGRPTALDIGCGVGLLHPYIRPLLGALTGVDTSAVSIEEARRSNRDVGYEVIDQSLPYDGQTFDVTLAVCVVHHVPPPQWPSFVSEMRRVTRQGGLMCIIEHNPLNPLTQLAVRRCSFDADAVLLRAGTTARLLRGAGASEAKTEFFLTLPTRHRLARGIEPVLGRLPFGAQYLATGKA